MSEILLGYEVGTGNEVRVPYAHTVVCGQTQASGKTTTLEGMISRADGRKAIAFATKQAQLRSHCGKEEWVRLLSKRSYEVIA